MSVTHVEPQAIGGSKRTNYLLGILYCMYFINHVETCVIFCCENL